MHSFDECELSEYRGKLKEELEQKYRVCQINKRFNKNNEQSFYCEICYCDGLPIATISYLDCGHYFCRDCLQSYYNYKIEVEGKVFNIKCPIASCEYKVEEKQI